MKTANRIEIRGSFDALFQRAADIAHWPDFLAHYRWVTILDRQGNRVVAEMAARHWGYPLWWRTIQISLPQERRILFTHIGGITKGMEVQWRFTPIDAAKWLVEIHHDFNPAWPFPGTWVAEHLIGNLFVKKVADKTLRRMKELAK